MVSAGNMQFVSLQIVREAPVMADEAAMRGQVEGVAMGRPVGMGRTSSLVAPFHWALALL